MNNIYPIVVPAGYFDLPPEAAKFVDRGLDAFGIVRPLGNDLFSLLVQVNGDVIKNVGDDDLAANGLDRAGAERAAQKNLAALAELGTAIQRQVNKTPSGFHFAVWFGDRFTSSCVLWPGLYEWARGVLETDQVIVMTPQVQLMCVASKGNPKFRAAIKGYMEKVVSDMDKLISMEWFELTSDGIAPLGAD